MRWGGALIAVGATAALVAANMPRGAADFRWATTAELAQPRAYASATLLPTGEIFVFGGLDENDPAVVNASTELIDPASGTVREIAQPSPGRLHHTLTLANGDTLVVAGGVEWFQGKFHSSDRVDVYLPFEHKWKRAAPLLQARSDHGAAPLPDGKVLVAGGNFGTLPLASSEIYDPRTDRWTKAAPMPDARVRFSIAPLPDGRVLVVGGLNRIGQPMTSSTIYDPGADEWLPGPELSMPRVEQAAVSLRGGDVLIIGGQGAASTTAERYDWKTQNFLFAGSLVQPRLIEQAALLPDGRVLITGGSLQVPQRTEWVPVAGAEVWDPVSNRWSEFTSPTLPRALGDLVVAGRDAYLIGGISDNLSALRTIERLSLR